MPLADIGRAAGVAAGNFSTVARSLGVWAESRTESAEFVRSGSCEIRSRQSATICEKQAPCRNAYLLSLLPSMSLGPGTLGRTLFEFGQTASLPDAERLAMRVIRGVEEIDLPFARRVTLRDDLENALYSEARKLGTSISDLRAKFEAADPAIAPAQLLVDAIQNMAVRDAKPGSLSKRIAAFAC